MNLDKFSHNGLTDYPDIQKYLIEDAKSLLELATQNEGELVGAISCLMTTIASIQLKIDRLKPIWEQQKKDSMEVKD